MDTLISNVTVVTMNERMEVLFGAYIGITDGKISWLAKKAPEEKPSQIIDGTGMVLLPGLVNCHTQLEQTLLRGYADDCDEKTRLALPLCLTSPVISTLWHRPCPKAASRPIWPRK